MRLIRFAGMYQDSPQRKPYELGLGLADQTEVKRRLAAIFSADVEGYSRLVGADEVATLDALTVRREILDGLIAIHGGQTVLALPVCTENLKCDYSGDEVRQGWRANK